MPKLDITKNDIPITEYLGCHRGFLTRKFIPFQGGRASDAYVFILDGSCRYKFDDGTEFEAKKDGILYLAKDAVYEMDINCDRYDFFVVNFNFMPNEPRQSAFFTLLSPSSAERLFLRLYYTRENLTPFTKNMTTLYQITSAILEGKERAYIGSEARTKIEKSADFIHLNFADSRLSVAMLAEQAGYSEVYFRKLFALRFGQAPSRYIMHTRVTNALKLMPLEEISLEKIAEESGFASLPYFTKVFKLFMGEPPAAYRRSLSKRSNIT